MNLAQVFLCFKHFKFPKFLIYEFLKAAYDEVKYKLIKTVGNNDPEICFAEAIKYENNELLLDSCKYVDVWKNTEVLCNYGDIRVLGPLLKSLDICAAFRYWSFEFRMELIYKYCDDIASIAVLTNGIDANYEGWSLNKLKTYIMMKYTTHEDSLFTKVSADVSIHDIKRFFYVTNYHYFFVYLKNHPQHLVTLIEYCLVDDQNILNMLSAMDKNLDCISWIKSDKKDLQYHWRITHGLYPTDTPFSGRVDKRAYFISSIENGTFYDTLYMIKNFIKN